MATGGASHLAGSAGLHPLVAPLLWLTVAEAGAIPLLGIGRRRSVARALRSLLAPGDAAYSFGRFTIPLGLAVVGAGLARGSGPAWVLGCVAVGLAWLTTIAFAVWVMAPVLSRRWGTAAVDGGWFLAPAAVLGDAIGTTAVFWHAPAGVRHGLGWLAVIACGLGVLGYLVVVGAAAARVARAGLCGTSLSPWWISAGCGGLAAGAIGQVATVAPVGGLGGVYRVSALVVWSIGSALLLPVLSGSIAYVPRLRRLRPSPPWPPTFSTAVYALGAIQTAALWRIHAIDVLGHAAALATVALWLATATLYLLLTPRRLQARR
jgi:hypothetical protein